MAEKFTDLPHDLEKKLNQFIDAQKARCLSHYSEKKLKETIINDFEWIREFAVIHYQSRIKRAEDLTDPKVGEAQKLAREYIGKGNHDFFATCVDGRNMPTVMFSKPPHIGGVLRAPAGVVTGFMEGQSPKSVFIDFDSYVVKQIKKLLLEKNGNTIYYGLDSHLGCAARAQIHATEGGGQVDGGVRADILSKIMIAEGILRLRDILHKENADIAHIVPIFFSFDPHTGGVITGLETHLNDADVAKLGFTNEILNRLSSKKLIVRTIDFLKDKSVVAVLEKAIKPKSADFRNDYPASLYQNWRAILELFDNGNGYIFKKFYEDLKVAYGSSFWKIGKDSLPEHSISDKTLRQKAKFLLKNLVTRFSIAGIEEKWPYDSHQEEMIVITDGGYAPFPALDAFAVFSQDLNALLANTKLTIDLIRMLRTTGKIKNPISSTISNKIDFPSAPVFISNKGILKNISPASWKSLQSLPLEIPLSKINWDDSRVLSWEKSDIQALILEAAKNSDINLSLNDSLQFVDGVYELFNRLRIMMKDKYFRQMILHGNIFVISTLVDRDRMPRFLVQFVI